ncbi:adenylate kinase [archaeon]|nr:adenylate kinase [archaeon]
MGGVFIVTGIPGVGKTTVIQKAIDGTEIKTVGFGSTMAEILRERGLGKTNDDVRKITDVELYKQIQKEAAERIFKMSEHETIVIDTHCALKSANGYINGLPEWVVKPLKPKVLVLVEGRPADIIKRREEDSGVRQRSDFGGEKEVEENQDLARAVAAAAAAFTGCRIKIILNEQRKIDKAAKELKEVLLSS